MSLHNRLKAAYRRYPDLCWTALVLVLACFVLFTVNRSRRPRSIELPAEDPTRMSPEHRHVEQALLQPESIAQWEAEAESQLSAEASDPAAPFSGASRPTPVTGTPLPATWDSAPAPDLNLSSADTLEPALRRSLAASASLRTDAFTDPGSARNQQQVEALRRLRQARSQP